MNRAENPDTHCVAGNGSISGYAKIFRPMKLRSTQRKGVIIIWNYADSLTSLELMYRSWFFKLNSF